MKHLLLLFVLLMACSSEGQVPNTEVDATPSCGSVEEGYVLVCHYSNQFDRFIKLCVKEEDVDAYLSAYPQDYEGTCNEHNR